MSDTDTQATATPPFEQILEQAPDAIIFADREGAIRLWNSAAARLFGHAAAEVLGENLDLIIPERFRKAHWTGFDRALQSGTTKYADRVLTTRAVHKDGRAIYLDLTFSLLKDAQGGVQGALAVARDCTERFLAERAARTGSADSGQNEAR